MLDEEDIRRSTSVTTAARDDVRTQATQQRHRCFVIEYERTSAFVHGFFLIIHRPGLWNKSMALYSALVVLRLPRMMLLAEIFQFPCLCSRHRVAKYCKATTVNGIQINSSAKLDYASEATGQMSLSECFSSFSLFFFFAVLGVEENRTNSVLMVGDFD